MSSLKVASIIGVSLVVLVAMRAMRPPAECDDRLVVPDGFCATSFADNVGPARHIVVAPGGVVYVATWREGQRPGGIVALRDTNGDGRADLRREFGVEGGSGLALRDSALFHATWEAVYRYQLSAGRLLPVRGPDTVVRNLPRLEHGARSIAVDGNNNLFVNIGVASNACERDYPRRDFRGELPCAELETSGGIWRFAADGVGQVPARDNRFATGLRHTVALAVNPENGLLYGAPHGIDHLHTWWPASGYSAEDAASLPAETLFRIDRGGDYGFPYCMYDPRSGGRMIVAPAYESDRSSVAPRCAAVPKPLAAFSAHSAPMALAWPPRDRLPEDYRGGVFVALHGSLFHAPLDPRGYAVMFVKLGDSASAPRVFATGRNTVAAGLRGVLAITVRPSGLSFTPDGALLVADDLNRRVWMIRWVGSNRTPR